MISTSYQHFTAVLMSACAEYITDMKGRYTTGSFFLSLPPVFLLFKEAKGKSRHGMH